jgi:hypothetical protein
LFPGDEDAKTFDKLERIQKLMILNTTKEMPRFSFLPVGKEIFHRLCLRTVVAKGLSEFITPSEKAGD